MVAMQIFRLPCKIMSIKNYQSYIHATTVIVIFIPIFFSIILMHILQTGIYLNKFFKKHTSIQQQMNKTYKLLDPILKGTKARYPKILAKNFNTLIFLQ